MPHPTWNQNSNVRNGIFLRNRFDIGQLLDYSFSPNPLLNGKTKRTEQVYGPKQKNYQPNSERERLMTLYHPQR